MKQEQVGRRKRGGRGIEQQVERWCKLERPTISAQLRHGTLPLTTRDFAKKKDLTRRDEGRADAVKVHRRQHPRQQRNHSGQRRYSLFFNAGPAQQILARGWPGHRRCQQAHRLDDQALMVMPRPHARWLGLHHGSRGEMRVEAVRLITLCPVGRRLDLAAHATQAHCKTKTASPSQHHPRQPVAFAILPNLAPRPPPSSLPPSHGRVWRYLETLWRFRTRRLLENHPIGLLQSIRVFKARGTEFL